MATQLKIRRGTTAEHASFTGAEGEITLDTTKDTLVAHDNYTAGGRPMLREDLDNLVNASIGAGKLDRGSATAYQALRVNAAANGVEFANQEIGQVKYVWTGSAQANSSNSYINATGMQIQITPRSTASRFLITFNFQGYFNTYGSIRITKDGSALWTPNATHSMGNGTGDPYNYITTAWLDHPNTTSQVTYRGQFAAYSSGSVTMNNPSNSGTSLIVMELMNYS